LIAVPKKGETLTMRCEERASYKRATQDFGARKNGYMPLRLRERKENTGQAAHSKKERIKGRISHAQFRK